MLLARFQTSGGSMLTRKKVALFLLAMVLLTKTVYSQISIRGTVTDPSDQPVAGALVEIIDERNTQSVYTDTTRQDGTFSVHVIATGVEENRANLPRSRVILGNYPNPFNPSTVIQFELSLASFVQIDIFNIRGMKIKSFPSGTFLPGSHRIIWDGTNHYRMPVAAGIYFCRLQTESETVTHKMTLLDGGTRAASGLGHPVNTAAPIALKKTLAAFQFTLRVSGASIGTLETRNLFCTGDTTMALQVNPANVTTIGPDGGSLTLDDFTLSVPAGILESPREIKVSVASNFDSFAEDAITEAFQISGLPPNLSEPVSVRLNYTGPKVDKAEVAASFYRTDPITGSNVLTHMMIEAVDSEGVLVADISSRGLNAVSLEKTIPGLYSETGSVVVQGVWSYPAIETDRVFIKYPSSYDEQFVRNEILPVLEENLTLCQDEMGFVLKTSASSILYQKIYIFFRAGPGLANALLDIHHTGQYRPTMYLNTDLLDQNDPYALRMVTGPLMLWLYMQENLIRLYPGLADFSACDSWFPETVQLWSHILFSEGNLDAPLDFDGYENDIFSGLNFAGSAMGRTPLIHFLIEDEKYKNLYGLLGPVNTIANIRENENTVQSLVQTVNHPVTEWLPDFYQSYLSGDIFNVSGSEFLEEIARPEKWSADSAQDTLHIFSESYADCSTKFFLVDVDKDVLSDDAELLIDADGPIANHDYGITVLLYWVNGNSLRFMGREDASKANLYIPDLKDNAALGMNRYLIAVVNSDHNETFDGHNDIDLTLSLNDQGAGQDFTHCSFVLKVGYDYFKCDRVGTPEENCNTITYDATYITADIDSGYNAGYQFTGTDHADDRLNTVSTLTCIFSPDLSEIETFEFVQTQYRSSGDVTIERRIVAEDIPQTRQGAFKYELAGEKVCSSMSTFEIDYTWTSPYPGSGTATSVDCSSASLSLSFWTEE